MSKIKNGGLDQCGAEPFEQQQFATAGVEGVKRIIRSGKNTRVLTYFYSVNEFYVFQQEVLQHSLKELPAANCRYILGVHTRSNVDVKLN